MRERGERRSGAERRTLNTAEVLALRSKQRRADQRRDSPRTEIALDMREPGGKTWACRGDLAVEGAAFVTTAPPMGDTVELMFTIPTYVGPIIARGKVVSRTGLWSGTLISVEFTHIDVEAQLSIAQWIEDLEKTGTLRPPRN